MPTTSNRRTGRLAFALTCVGAAVAYLVIGLVRDETGFAIAGPAVMLGYAAVLLAFGQRSEALGLLSRNPSDERQAQIMLRAGATTGLVLVGAVVVGALSSLAIGSSAAFAFCALCAVGGVTFVAATVWFARHT